MNRIMIKGIRQFAIIASSEESVVFYKRLGFKETNRIDRSYDIVVNLAGFDMELILFIDPNHPARAKEPENIGIRNMAFQVDDLESVINEFDCGPVLEDWFGRKYCFTNDPDGLPIEFYEQK